MELHSNNLPAARVEALAVKLVEDAGCAVIERVDREFIKVRADRGWCAAEIARAFVRANFAKGNPMRRRLLVALTSLGAPSRIA